MSAPFIDYASIRQPTTPASPGGSQFARSATPGKQPFGFSTQPLSPPLSVSASQFDASPPSSPHINSFTSSSAVPMSTQASQQGLTSAAHTPTHDCFSDQNSKNDSDIVMQDAELQQTLHTSLKRKYGDEDIQGPEITKRQRTDHDRQAPANDHSIPVTLYKTRTDIPEQTTPHSTDDFFGLYKLTGIAASVARNDPKTGEKINAMKKSYKPKLKDLPGKNRAPANPGELRGLIDYPDEEWHIQKIMGKDLSRYSEGDEQAGHDAAAQLMGRFANAFKVQPGKLPKAQDEEWAEFLGFNDGLASKATATAPPRTKAAIVGTNPAAYAATTTAVADINPAMRLRRASAKRSYDDNSFEGYGDELSDSDPDDDRRGPKAKRRRVSSDSTDHLFRAALLTESNRRATLLQPLPLHESRTMQDLVSRLEQLVEGSSDWSDTDISDDDDADFLVDDNDICKAKRILVTDLAETCEMDSDEEEDDGFDEAWAAALDELEQSEAAEHYAGLDEAWAVALEEFQQSKAIYAPIAGLPLSSPIEWHMLGPAEQERLSSNSGVAWLRNGTSALVNSIHCM